jgi:D-glycero-alpha-D-manno-heptose-7-phosphate kinase
MLFFTGIKRTSSNVSSSYVGNLEQHKRQLRTVRQLVDEALNLLNGQSDLRGIGDLLRESWEMKRSLSQQVSSSRVDGVVERALAAGALGGKLTGAGGGGFLLLFVPPERQAAVKAALHGLLHVPFQFEWGGSQIIFADADADYSQADLERPEAPVWDDLELQAVD